MISPAYGLALEANATNAQDLADCYGPWVGLRSNHVTTGAGEFAGSDGSSRSISGKADRQLLVALRAQADLIVVDAETARRERYKLPTSGAGLAIFSRTGTFSGIPAIEENPKLCFLFSPKTNTVTQKSEHVLITLPENPLQNLTKWAESKGFAALLLEAGPTLSRLAFINKLVGRSAITISENGLGVDFIAKAHPFDQSANLLSVAHSEQASFTYWSH